MSSQTKTAAAPLATIGQTFGRERAKRTRRGWHTMAVLIAMGGVGCGESETTQPVMPGSIVLTTTTSGFLKDDSYELLVNGESQGAIGADDQMTIADLDPATYELELGDVADNCVVEGTSASVVSDEAVAVSLDVVCAYATSSVYSLRFSRERPDLETGNVVECPFSLCPSGAEWDLYVHYNSSSDPHSVIRQNQTTNVEIAHVTGVTLDDLAEEDFASATFTADLVADSFDTGRVILIRTELGHVYALGNPVEDTLAQTLTFDVVVIAQP